MKTHSSFSIHWPRCDLTTPVWTLNDYGSRRNWADPILLLIVSRHLSVRSWDESFHVIIWIWIICGCQDLSSDKRGNGHESASYPTEKLNSSRSPSLNCSCWCDHGFVRLRWITDGICRTRVCCQGRKRPVLLLQTLPLLATRTNRTTQQTSPTHVPKDVIVPTRASRNHRAGSARTQSHATKVPRLPHTARILRCDPLAGTAKTIFDYEIQSP